MDDIPDDGGMFSSEEYQSELMRFLNESSDMKKRVKGAMKQTLITAVGTLAGSLLLGPAGGVAGAGFGAMAGYRLSDDYDGILTEISELDSERKKVRYKTI